MRRIRPLSKKPHFGGCAPQRGLWPQIRTRSRFLCNWPIPKLSTYVYSFGSYRVDTQTNPQTNRRRRKHPTFFATLRRWVKILTPSDPWVDPTCGHLRCPFCPAITRDWTVAVNSMFLWYNFQVTRCRGISNVGITCISNTYNSCNVYIMTAIMFDRFLALVLHRQTTVRWVDIYQSSPKNVTH